MLELHRLKRGTCESAHGEMACIFPAIDATRALRMTTGSPERRGSAPLRPARKIVLYQTLMRGGDGGGKWVDATTCGLTEMRSAQRTRYHNFYPSFVKCILRVWLCAIWGSR